MPSIPVGTAEELVTAVGPRFHRDYIPVLHAVLFAVDRHRAHKITGPGAAVNGIRSGLRLAWSRVIQLIRLARFRSAAPGGDRR